MGNGLSSPKDHLTGGSDPFRTRCLSLRLWLRVGVLLGILGMLVLPVAAAPTNSAWIAHAWQSDDGLPNNSITSIAQTPDGYLWVANPSRLARFDGVKFEDFASRNIVAGHDERVSTLLASRRGGLWVAMDHGPVVHLLAGTEKVITNGLPDLNAQTMCEDQDGALWIAYRSGVLCRIKDDIATQFLAVTNGALSGAACWCATDIRGQLWFYKGGQIGLFRGGNFVSLFTIPGNIPVRLAAAKEGGLWIVQGLTLYRCNETNGLQLMAQFQPEDLNNAEPTALLESSRGSVWVGTSDSGLFRFNGHAFESIPTSHRAILSLAEDREGNIWAGTGGGGLNRVQPRPVVLETTESGLPFNAVQSICQDTNGTIWAVTQNFLLVCRTNNGWMTISTNANWPGGKANCVAPDQQGGIWIGTESGYLNYLRNGQFSSWRAANGLTVRHIRSLMISHNGDVWIGGATRENLQRFSAGQFKTFTLPPESGIVRAMAEDASGSIWIGTSKHILLRLTGDKIVDEAAKVSSLGKSVRALLTTPDGGLWIGYAGSGLGRWKDGQFTQVTAREGLYDDFISQIVDDGKGWLWFGSDHGIFKVREREFDDFAAHRSTSVRSIHYGSSAGLPSLQAVFGDSPGSLQSRDGRVWLPMLSALAIADPNSLREDTKPPPVLLKRVSVDEQTIAVYGGAAPVQGPMVLDRTPTQLRLAPGHHRVEFEFTALNFMAPENIHFRYRLEGYDETWTDAGTTRIASYSRLPAGNYQFRVKACNSDGVWNETGSTLAFSVAPFLWQTWWFRLSATVSFTLIVLAASRVLAARRLRERLQEVNRQAALEHSRMAGMAEVATSVLHNVGNVLNSVNISSTVIGDHVRNLRVSNLGKVSALLTEHASDLPGFFSKDPKGQRLPGYLADLAVHLAQEREQILEELRSLQNGIEHIKKIVVSQQSFARASGVLEQFNLTEVIEDALRIHAGSIEHHQVHIVRDYQQSPQITSDKHRIMQILINLIANAKQAVNRSGAEEKCITLRVAMNGDQKAKISVIDNGIGITPENLTKVFHYGFTTRKDGHGFGLHSGALAAKELGGSLSVQSDGPGRGATFTLELPSQPPASGARPH